MSYFVASTQGTYAIPKSAGEGSDICPPGGSSSSGGGGFGGSSSGGGVSRYAVTKQSFSIATHDVLKFLERLKEGHFYKGTIMVCFKLFFTLS